MLSEVTAAVSIDECRWLTQACAGSDAVYMMAENYIYMKPNVLVQALVEAGLFGETYYAEGEYLHELSSLHHMPDGSPTWRYYWQVGVNGSTLSHPQPRPLPDVDQGAARTDQLRRHGRLDRPRARDGGHRPAALQDRQRQADARAPRHAVQAPARDDKTTPCRGTKGAYESARRPGEGDWIWLEDFCKEPDVWVPLKEFEEEFLPEIWRDPPPEAVNAGHGGGDYFEVMDFVDAVQGRKPPPIDVHAAMDMTLPGLVSQESIGRDGEWLPVPNSRAWVSGG